MDMNKETSSSLILLIPREEESTIVEKLQESAKGGNIEAVKALLELQELNRFNELVNNMDDDEFTP